MTKISTALFIIAYLIFSVGPANALKKDMHFAAIGDEGDVIFSHEVHTEINGLRCDQCHPNIFLMRKDSTEGMTMSAMDSGSFCGYCHNGGIAFDTSSSENCPKCHSGWVAYSATNEEGPDIPFEDKGACPFEGCLYGEWTANQFTYIKNDRNEESSDMFTVENGEKVSGVTGVVITTKPGHAQVLKSMMLAGVNAGAGDIVYLLTYQGEGTYKAWYKGQLIDGFSMSDMTLLDEPESIWWVQIKNKNGLTGWSNQTDNFDHKDRFGEGRPEEPATQPVRLSVEPIKSRNSEGYIALFVVFGIGAALIVVVIYKVLSPEMNASSSGNSNDNRTFAGNGSANKGTGYRGSDSSSYSNAEHCGSDTFNQRGENRDAKKEKHSTSWNKNESVFRDKVNTISSDVTGILAGVFDRNYLHKNLEALRVLKEEVNSAYKDREISKEGLSLLSNNIDRIFGDIKRGLEKEKHQQTERDKEFEVNEKKLAWAVDNFYNLVGVYDPYPDNSMQETRKKIIDWKNLVFEIKKKGVRSWEIKKIMELFENGNEIFSRKTASFYERMSKDKDAKNREWAERQKEKEKKQKEREAYQQEKEKKQREWEERQREKERKHREWEAEQSRRKAEFEARQREYERKKREREERQREREAEQARRKAEYEERQRERERRKSR